MYLRNPCKYLKLASLTIRLFLAFLTSVLLSPALQAKTAALCGVIFTVGSDHVQTVWPNARVTLRNLDTKNESATVSDQLGTYSFTGIAYGHYEITVTLAGFARARLLLLNSGHQDYREFLAMLRWRAGERTTVFASYVHSRAYGELNDYNRFFGNYSSPLIRANQYGPLSSDAPDRGLFWDVIGLPHKLDFIPIFDVHTGFPFSRVDRNWNYIGPENRAGRFPTFLALDTKLQYPVDFTFHDHRIQFRAGLSVYNVLNHSNPRTSRSTMPHRTTGPSITP